MELVVGHFVTSSVARVVCELHGIDPSPYRHAVRRFQAKYRAVAVDHPEYSG
jgi:hypothetical protein